MRKNYKNEKGYTQCWYSLTANRLLMTLGPLKGEVNCDVCIVGGGFTGLSAALELSEKGMSVILLEAGDIAGGGSGRNGGQIIRGFDKSPDDLITLFGKDDAKTLCNMTLEGLALILQRIARHDIKCDLKFGHLTTALNKKHAKQLKQSRDEWDRIGHTDLEYIDKTRTQSLVASEHYIGGLFDPKGAHIHPVNYALGIAQAAQKAGCKIYDQTTVTEIIPGKTPRVITKDGAVTAQHVILAGATNIKGAETMRYRTLNATAHMIATEPLKDKGKSIVPGDIAVCDSNFVMNYFRLSDDGRVLFGGNCLYHGKNPVGEDLKLRTRLGKIFPRLSSIPLEHCWHGTLNLTLNRLPAIGRMGNNIYYAHGFGGHGIIATNIAGKVIAEAVAGTAGRMDLFEKIKHRSIPSVVKYPLFMLGVTWYRLRDLL
ncbi:MAG: FAD-binding oxidoreductase [Alphaproteobacteria bacterium]|nr:FAD-binding oxidoreductase [Alphaproteobacteria bacterium]